MFGEPSTPKAGAPRPGSWPPAPYMTTPTSRSAAAPFPPPIDPSLLPPSGSASIHTPTLAATGTPTKQLSSPYPTSASAQRHYLSDQQQYAYHYAQTAPAPSLSETVSAARPALYATSSSSSALSPALSPSQDRDELQTPLIPECSPPFGTHHQHEHDGRHLAPNQLTAHGNSAGAASPMPYPTTPSPQTYGISGSMIVSEPHIMQATDDASCTPILPSQPDVFMSAASGKTARPVLRTTLSHNGAYLPQAPSAWPRRLMPSVSESNERSRPATSAESTYAQHGSSNVASLLTSTAPIGTTYAAPPPPQAPLERALYPTPAQAGVGISRVAEQSLPHAHPHPEAHTHETASSASALTQSHQSATTTGFSASLPSFPPIQTNTSYAAPPPPNFATAQSVPIPINTSHSIAAPGSVPVATSHGSYSDEITLHPSYASPYDSVPAYSPWPQHSSLPSHSELQGVRSQHVHHGYPYPPLNGYWQQTAPTKMDEPILAPGELPAPRPPPSYAALIGEALLLAAPPHQLYVSEISESIKRRYAYYRQNPSKVYNGVRHQTSMCKAFVKLPRPYGDQSGGARKWAIRAGCEGWFHSGGYHPPSGSSPTMSHASVRKANSIGPAGGKAKSTARAKQLAIGITSPEMQRLRAAKQEHEPFSPSSGHGGPSVGPAFDGTGRVTWSQAPPPASSMYAHPATHPSPAHPHHLPPPAGMPYQHPHHQLPHGYHYLPIQQQHPGAHYQHQGQTYVPVYHPQAYHQQPHHSAPPHAHAHSHAEQSPEQGYMPTPVTSSQATHPHSEGSPVYRYEGDVRAEQQQQLVYAQQQPCPHSHHTQAVGGQHDNSHQYPSPSSSASGRSAMHHSPHSM